MYKTNTDTRQIAATASPTPTPIPPPAVRWDVLESVVDRAVVEVDVYRGCVELSTKDEEVGVMPGPFKVALSRYVEVADSAGGGVKPAVGKVFPECEDTASVGVGS